MSKILNNFLFIILRTEFMFHYLSPYEGGILFYPSQDQKEFKYLTFNYYCTKLQHTWAQNQRGDFYVQRNRNQNMASSTEDKPNYGITTNSESRYRSYADQHKYDSQHQPRGCSPPGMISIPQLEGPLSVLKGHNTRSFTVNNHNQVTRMLFFPLIL